MLPWLKAPSVTLDGALPPRDRYARLPEDARARARDLLAALEAEAPDKYKLLADLADLRTGGRYHQEAVALADAIGVDWRTVLAANLTYDLAMALYGCSTVALATATGPVLARNMDWWPQEPLARSSYRVRTETNGRLSFANAGWPGAIGVVSGLSGRGFGVVLNAVHGTTGIDKLGYPVLLHVRRVLEDARDFDDAVHRLCHQRLCAVGILTLVGRENDQRVIIERTPREHALRTPYDDEPLLATNHYRRLAEPGDAPDGQQCPRYVALGELYGDVGASVEVSDAQLLYGLTDENVIQDITVQHVIMRPRDESIALWVPRRLVGDA